jgi:hypothetical protein
VLVKLIAQYVHHGRPRPPGAVIDVSEAEARGLIASGIAAPLPPARGGGGCRNCGRP